MNRLSSRDTEVPACNTPFACIRPDVVQYNYQPLYNISPPITSKSPYFTTVCACSNTTLPMRARHNESIRR